MNEILNHYKDLQLKDIAEAYSCTCQLITIKDGNPKSHGTGIFIEVDAQKFLVTAAHVIDNKTDNLFIPVGEHNLLSPGGDVTFTALTQNREKDKIDIAIFKLYPETVSKIPPIYKFLSQSQLGVSHEFLNLPMYSAVGFPTSKSKIKYKEDKFITKPFFYTTMPTDAKFYEQLNRDFHSNIIVNYDKNRVFNHTNSTISNGPDTYGMSGCGLWFSDPKEIVSGNNSKQLVAVMTDWPKENRKCWIGTRIDVITEVLRIKYGLNLPKSNILKVSNLG